MDVKLGTRTYRENCSTVAKAAYAEKFERFGVEKENGKASKLEYMHFRDKSTTSAKLGIRITAMSVAKPLKVALRSTDGRANASSGTGRGATSRELFPYFECPSLQQKRGIEWYARIGARKAVVDSFAYFLHNGRTYRDDVLAAFLAQLREFETAIRSSPLFASKEIIGSSLLFVYDGAANGGHAKIRWIDFAHVYEPTIGSCDCGTPANAAGRAIGSSVEAAVKTTKKKDGILKGVRNLVSIFEEIQKAGAEGTLRAHETVPENQIEIE
jgi:hypothetical protein